MKNSYHCLPETEDFVQLREGPAAAAGVRGSNGDCSTRQGHCQLPGAASQGGAGPHDGQAQPHGTQRARAEQLQQLPPGQSKAQMTTQFYNGKLVQGPASK